MDLELKYCFSLYIFKYAWHLFLVYDMLYFYNIYTNNYIKTQNTGGKIYNSCLFPFWSPYGLFRVPWDQNAGNAFQKFEIMKPKEAEGTSNNLGRILRCVFKLGSRPARKAS